MFRNFLWKTLLNINWRLCRQVLSLFVRSSHRSCSVRKGVLKFFAKYTGKHLCQSLFFNKDAGTGLRTGHLWRLLLVCAIYFSSKHWHRTNPDVLIKFSRLPMWIMLPRRFYLSFLPKNAPFILTDGNCL